MFFIQQITDYPLQNKTLTLPDGSPINITLKFVPMQKSWIITDLTYGDFNVKGIKIVKNPNILRQFKNIIPFGIACDSIQNRDPMFVEDFKEQVFNLYLLSREDVQAYEEYLSASQV